jgi:hypothetical protein
MYHASFHGGNGGLSAAPVGGTGARFGDWPMARSLAKVCRRGTLRVPARVNPPRWTIAP